MKIYNKCKFLMFISIFFHAHCYIVDGSMISNCNKLYIQYVQYTANGIQSLMFDVIFHFKFINV
jgi:hypothetical protein